jgi:beta-glucanase (GH16 family)
MYGRFAANCSLPTRKATGIWPAFWTLPQSDECWPTGGEIDIFEMNGDHIQV